MFIIDTMVLSESMLPQPDGRILAWLDLYDRELLFTTAICAAELRSGAAHLPVGRRQALLTDKIEAVLTLDFAGRILPFDAEASIAYATITTRRRKAGLSVEELDAQIAAVAMVHGMTVVTRNTRHFGQDGVPLINPWEG